MAAKYVTAIILLFTITSAYARSAKCPIALQVNGVLRHPTPTKYFVCLESGFLAERECPRGTEFNLRSSVCMHVAVDERIKDIRNADCPEITTPCPVITTPCPVITTPCPVITTPCPCPPDNGGTTPDNGGTTPDNGGTTPDNGGTTPDNGGTTPDNGGTTPDNGGGTTPCVKCEDGIPDSPPPIGYTTPPPNDDCADGKISQPVPIVTTPAPIPC